MYFRRVTGPAGRAGPAVVEEDAPGRVAATQMDFQELHAEETGPVKSIAKQTAMIVLPTPRK